MIMLNINSKYGVSFLFLGLSQRAGLYFAIAVSNFFNKTVKRRKRDIELQP